MKFKKLLASSVSVLAMLNTLQVHAVDEGDTSAMYVLMNIPYAEFYAEESDTVVDAVSSATMSKPLNSNLAGGSYHNNADGSDISGVTYPVLVTDPADLTGLTQVTDEDTLDITVNDRGTEKTTTYVGKETLFGAGDYAYYVLSEDPACYKELSADADGGFSFSEVNGEAETVEASAEITSTSRYGDYQITVNGLELSGNVSGILLTNDEGESYGLRHLENIWLKTNLAFSADETYEGLVDTTITSITYLTQEGVYYFDTDLYVAPPVEGEVTAEEADPNTVVLTGLPDDMEDAAATVYYTEGSGRTAVNTYAAEDAEVVNGEVETSTLFGRTYSVKVTSSNYADITVMFDGDAYYVLMDIPYADFYAAELNNETTVDAVTSATYTKPKSGSLVGGSYHQSTAEDGEEYAKDISGIIYPVEVMSEAALAGTEITDESSVTIETTNRGQTSTTEYTGADALFEAPSYSWYELAEAPAAYKTVTVADGVYTFSAVQGVQAETLSDASAEIATSSDYGDYQITVTGLPESVTEVSAVVLTAEDGTSYGLRHLENIWRISNLAFSTGHQTVTHGCPLSYEHYAALEGKTITSITYITQDAEYTISCSLYAAPYMTTEVTAAEASADTVTVTGLPEDIENAKAAVYYTEGTGREAVNFYVAENADVVDGMVTTSQPLEAGRTYTVVITSDNYAASTSTFEGKEEAVPAEEEEKTPSATAEPEASKSTAVQTGDSLNVTLYAGLFGTACAVLMLLFVFRRRLTH